MKLNFQRNENDENDTYGIDSDGASLFSACSTDSADPILGGIGGDNSGDKVTVHMTLSTASSSGTRATLSWEMA